MARTCNAETVHKWTRRNKCRKKTVHGVRPIHITHDVVMLLDCRRSFNASIMTRHPLAPLEEHSRPRWFLERPRTCRHLQTAEDAGIAGNDLELPADAVELDIWYSGESSTYHMPRVILKNVFSCHGVCGFEVVLSLSRWPRRTLQAVWCADDRGTLLTNLAELRRPYTLNHFQLIHIFLLVWVPNSGAVR